uniref:non-specific serine/threonine protein kinase n=1 Tax=Chenopodium quinoa TaxID=63459 RepID=A0A803LL33_CHEQI
MNMYFDENSTISPLVTSWKSASDPSDGRFTVGINHRRLYEVFIWDGVRPYWRSGPWNGQVLMGIRAMYYFAQVDGFNLENDNKGTVSISVSSITKRLTKYYVLTYDGRLLEKDWQDDKKDWKIEWNSLESECDIYGKCGEFGSCNSNSLPICSCLRGFQPRNDQEWSAGNWSSGCVRRTPLQCANIGGEDDGFSRLRNVKVPDDAEWLESYDEEDCRRKCLRNCSCLAYAYTLGFGCMIWNGSLIDVQNFAPVGPDIFIRLAHSEIDPSSGKFTVGINTLVPPQVFLWNDDHPNWRNSPWNGNIFLGKGSVLSILTDNDGTTYFGYPSGNQSTQQHFVVNYDGSLVQKEWNTGSRKWEVIWSAQEFDCNNYGKCGAFGICNQTNSIICGCLKGFVPKNYEEWSKGNWTDGCVRRTSLLCETKGDRADVFWKLGNVKVPDNAEWFSANGEDDCRSQCLGKCNQQKQQPKQAKTRKRNIILVVMVIIGITTAAAVMYFVWRWMRQRNGVMRITSKETLLQNTMLKGITSKAEVGDLPVFGLKKLAIATDNFQDSNKLGRGGFGTVYKGKFEDGQEIAVKRLSKASGQGLEEFMTEVLVISKLQHRNLVKLLGCCVEGEEKMLVYELMPNKSLDALLFDPTYQKILDWEKRLNIILGICRGLLYLHRDSRLRIIHRDLKASNILLDGNLNPKISDFGMARIFGGNQDQGDTNRIVGTYGYMSPEYAMEGRFSEKSDVFSFGVLLLEVLSGRRNSSFKDEECSSLLGHAWNLWNDDNILSLIDPTISESTRHAEILKCIQLGLLCVQEVPEDRPSVSMVISMIESQVTDLPHPTQPGFTQRRIASHNEAQQNAHEYCSVDRASITVLSGR